MENKILDFQFEPACANQTYKLQITVLETSKMKQKPSMTDMYTRMV